MEKAALICDKRSSIIFFLQKKKKRSKVTKGGERE